MPISRSVMTHPTKFHCYKFPATVTVSRAVVLPATSGTSIPSFRLRSYSIYSSTLATYLASASYAMLVSHAFSFQINSNKLNILFFALFYVSGN